MEAVPDPANVLPGLWPAVLANTDASSAGQGCLSERRPHWPGDTFLRSALTWLSALLFVLPVKGLAGTNLASRIRAATSVANETVAFPDVVEATTGHHIIAFDANVASHAELRRKLVAAAELALANARAKEIKAARPNEAGNKMEAFVKSALTASGLPARTPITASGRAQSAGYPDIEIVGNPYCYLELKTYSKTAENSSQRTFYYSPTDNPKVTHDAVHLLLAYELERRQQAGQTTFIPTRWRLISLEGLQVRMKLEFNQSNRGLYGDDAGPPLLGESNEPSR